MLTTKQVADYLLAHQDSAAEPIGNLKLQKLCYYAQAFSLAMYGQALFAEPIKAWEHGPVVPTLWHKYKGFYSIPIPDVDEESYPEWAKNVMNLVLATYGMQTGFTLREMTHAEDPWRNAYQKGGSAAITRSSLSSYFKDRVEKLSANASRPRPLDKAKIRDLLLADTELAKLTTLGAEDLKAGRYDKIEIRSVMIRPNLSGATRIEDG